MARSSYIYVLWKFGTPDRILGMFTVKHEMETYRQRLTGTTYVERFRDGQPDVTPTLLD
jgi:hypothetical protein